MATSAVQCIGKLRRYQKTTRRGFYCRPEVVIYGKTINGQNGHLWNYQRLMTQHFVVSLEARIYDRHLLYFKKKINSGIVPFYFIMIFPHIFVNKRNQRNKIRKGSNSQCCLPKCAGKIKLVRTLQANCLLVYSFVFFRPPGEKCNGMNFTVCAFHASCQGQSSNKSTVNKVRSVHITF